MRSITGASSAGLRDGDLLAAHLRLEQRAQVAPVLAGELRGLEVAGEALDDLPRELELGLLHLVSSTASEISACE